MDYLLPETLRDKPDLVKGFIWGMAHPYLAHQFEIQMRDESWILSKPGYDLIKLYWTFHHTTPVKYYAMIQGKKVHNGPIFLPSLMALAIECLNPVTYCDFQIGDIVLDNQLGELFEIAGFASDKALLHSQVSEFHLFRPLSMIKKVSH